MNQQPTGLSPGLKLTDSPRPASPDQLGHASLGANDAAHEALRGSQGADTGLPVAAVILLVVVGLAVLGVAAAMVRGGKSKA